MRNSVYTLFLCFFAGLIFTTASGYSDNLRFVENTEELEYCVDSNDLRLVSGGLYLNCGNGLINLTSLRYENQRWFVRPKAIVTYCSSCEKFVLFGLPHNCNGVIR